MSDDGVQKAINQVSNYISVTDYKRNTQDKQTQCVARFTVTLAILEDIPLLLKRQFNTDVD